MVIDRTSRNRVFVAGRKSSGTFLLVSLLALATAFMAASRRAEGQDRPKSQPPGRDPASPASAFVGTPDLPDKVLDDGMTLDQAIDRFLKENLELRALHEEIAMARADVEAAGQPPRAYLLIDVGAGGIKTWPVQPRELFLTRWLRILVARAVLQVIEAQYDDAVRTRIDDLYTAFVDVQEARTQVRFASIGLRGIQSMVRATEILFNGGQISRADFTRVNKERDRAALACAEAETSFRKATLVLANRLNLSDAEAERLRIRDDEGQKAADAREAPAVEDLIRRARGRRPDLRAYRLGLQRAQLELLKSLVEPLDQVNVYPWPERRVSVRPSRARNDSPWSVTAIVTLPTTIRNRGVLKRAAINVAQTRTQLAKVERDVVLDVRKARMDYEHDRSTLDRLHQAILPNAKKAMEDARERHRIGVGTLTEFLEAQREFNTTVHQYLEGTSRLRRSMLALNTAVGERIMP